MDLLFSMLDVYGIDEVLSTISDVLSEAGVVVARI
jgi:hypothetical protein